MGSIGDLPINGKGNYPIARSMSHYRAPSLFQPHRCREALRDWRAGKIPTMNGLFLGITSTAISLAIAPQGWDHVMIDWAHSNCNTETMTQMVHNISLGSEGRSIPWVRIPGHDHAKMAYALDAGASVMVPQVETVAEARHVISSSKFGLKMNGTRSAPPFRLLPGLTDGLVDGSKTLHQNLNEQAAIAIQIETLQGIHNLDAILTEVPDIDAVWLGTLDTRISMDLPGNGGMGGNEPEWVEAVALFKATLAKHPNVCWMGFSMGSDEQLLAGAEGKAIVVSAGDIVALMGLLGELGRAKTLLGSVNNVKNVHNVSNRENGKVAAASETTTAST